MFAGRTNAAIEPDRGPAADPGRVAEPPAGRLMARTIHVDPTATTDGDGSLARPYKSWASVVLRAGDVAMQRGGTVAKGFAVTAQGTDGQGIVIGSYGEGKARIEGSLLLVGARNVVVENLDITGGNGHGIIMAYGTAQTTVRDCWIHGGIGGIAVIGGIAPSNRIIDNRIYENDFAGIWFDHANAARGAETLVSGNTIFRNGQQGILLHGSHVIIDSNTIVNNGLSGLPGISAVHVFGESGSDTACHANVISNNTIAHQRDGSSSDGNGIMLDHWTTDHAVIGNRIFGNDGAGISIFSASDNLVLDNLVHDNMVDAGGTHVISKAEIYFGEAGFAPGMTRGNLFANNTVRAGNKNAAAIQVETVVTPETSNLFNNNRIAAAEGGKLFIWGRESGTLLADWNVLTPGGSDTPADLQAPPQIEFAAPMLDRRFTLQSNALRANHTDTLSMLVAHGTRRDITGSPLGSWMAGDGRNNVLTGVGGNNLIAAGSGNAILRGGTGNDFLFGGAGNNQMFAGNANATMIGGSGSSRVVGGAGDDLIFAGNGSGRHVLDGGGGENTLVGGEGADTFVVGAARDFITGFRIGQDRLDVSPIGARGIADLQLIDNAGTAAILDRAGTLRVVLDGVDARRLTAADFLFARADGAALVSIARLAASGTEGHAGTTRLTFTVSRSGDLSGVHSARWTVAGMAGAKTAAAAGDDFAGGALPSDIVRFAAGERARTITVEVAGDPINERDEGFRVTLSDPSPGLTIGIAAAIGEIRNDDAQIGIARLRAARSEGTAGPSRATFTVTRTGNTTGAASVDWAVTGGTVAGTLPARASDFLGNIMPSGSIAFAAGETSRVLAVDIAGDRLVEHNESYAVTLSNASAGVTIGAAVATGVIHDDDAPGTGRLAITADRAMRFEGDRGATFFIFTVTRTGDLSGAARADWRVEGGGVAFTAAANGKDFRGGVLPSGRLFFAPSQAEKTLTIKVATDTTAELNDSFTVILSGGQAGLAMDVARATGVILNDDMVVSKPEGETLQGTTAPDIFVLGGGLDTASGAGGRDEFRFMPAAIGSESNTATTLRDFDPAAGERIDLSRIDAIAASFGDDAFRFIGTAPLSDVAGQLRWEERDGIRLIQGDVNGDRWADLTIHVWTAGPVEAGWFVL